MEKQNTEYRLQMNYAIDQLKKEIKQEKQDFTTNLNE